MSAAATAAEQHYRDVVARIMRAALDAVDPEKAVLRALRRSGSLLEMGGQTYDLNEVERIFLVGGG